MTDTNRIAQLNRAREDLKKLEVQLPPGAQAMEPLARLFNSIAAVKNRIKNLEAAMLPVTTPPKEPA